MIVDSKCKMEKLCDENRGALQYLKLETYPNTDKPPKLISCNGHALACLTVEADPAEAGFVPVKAIQAARKIDKRGDLNITLNGACVFSDNSTMPRPKEGVDNDGRYPDWQKVVPDKPVTVRLGINAKLLFTLSEALGAHNNYVTLELTAEKIEGEGTPSQIGAMYVRVPNQHNRFGVIMPVRVD